MVVIDAPETVQRPYNSSTKAVRPPPPIEAMTLLADGSRETLAALADINRLAGDLHSPLSVVHLRGNESAAELDAMIAGLSGVVALRPRRHSPVPHFLVGSQCERLLGYQSLSVLALPSDGQLPPIARVLFPADLSPRSLAAFDRTVALCQALDAELHLLHVYGEDRLLPSEQDLARRAATTNPRELMSIDQEQLRSLVARATAQGVRAQVKTAEGRAHAQILAYAAANAIGLISMVTHGPRTSEDILLGSTTVRVIEKSPVAVLAVRG